MLTLFLRKQLFYQFLEVFHIFFLLKLHLQVLSGQHLPRLLADIPFLIIVGRLLVLLSQNHHFHIVAVGRKVLNLVRYALDQKPLKQHKLGNFGPYHNEVIARLILVCFHIKIYVFFGNVNSILKLDQIDGLEDRPFVLVVEFHLVFLGLAFELFLFVQLDR